MYIETWHTVVNLHTVQYYACGILDAGRTMHHVQERGGLV